MDWDIRPLAGAGPLNFGMTPDDAAKLLGAANRRVERKSGNAQEYRAVSEPILTFDENGILIEITFSKEVEKVQLDGLDLFNADWETTLRHIRALDNDLLDVAGSIVSPKLSLSLTGFDSDDEEDQSISVAMKGLNDKYIGQCPNYVFIPDD